jgi:prepilin-type N-terminal cleavage/methylation domain-containing protein
MNKRLINEKGITLVELLATIVLISIIGALSYSLLSQGYSNYQRINAESELRDEADIIMSTLIKDLFSAKTNEVRLVNSCSSNGYSTTNLTISKKNRPVQKINFTPTSIHGDGIVTIDNVPVKFSEKVSLALYPCSKGSNASDNRFNISSKNQLSYTLQYQLKVKKNGQVHTMDFENTFNLINN